MSFYQQVCTAVHQYFRLRKLGDKHMSCQSVGDGCYPIGSDGHLKLCAGQAHNLGEIAWECRAHQHPGCLPSSSSLTYSALINLFNAQPAL